MLASEDYSITEDVNKIQLMGLMNFCHLACSTNFSSVLMDDRQEGVHLLIWTVLHVFHMF